MSEPQGVSLVFRIRALANSFGAATAEFQDSTPSTNAADEENIANSFTPVSSIFPFMSQSWDTR